VSEELSPGPEAAATAAPPAPSDRGPEASTQQADALVRQHMRMALAVGLIPVPLVDLAALTALQLRLLSRLAQLYRVDFSDQLGKAAIGTLIGSGGSTLASAGVRRLIPHLAGLPFILVGATSTALFAGASTYAIGRVFIQHFASGGTFLTFDPERVRKFYEEALAQGRDEVQMSFAGVKP
jgi:uncharacterized protein (DUF697 family)